MLNRDDVEVIAELHDLYFTTPAKYGYVALSRLDFDDFSDSTSRRDVQDLIGNRGVVSVINSKQHAARNAEVARLARRVAETETGELATVLVRIAELAGRLS